MAWLKLTAKALYLMKGGTNQYLEKVNLRPFNSDQALTVPLQWFDPNSKEAPRAMLVAVNSTAPEPDFYASLKVTAYKTEVQVNETFTIEGSTDETHAGKPVILTIDNQIKTTAPAVLPNGQWKLDFRFTQAGKRLVNIAVGGESVNLTISVQGQEASRRFQLTASVGRGGSNRQKDVLAVKQRLMDLGYNGLQLTASVDTATINAIQLFQAIIAERSQVTGVDGRVDPNGFTHQWLQAENAPGWQLMPLEGEGFFNYERQDESDNHDYGTSWMTETLIGAGKTYQKNYRNANPRSARIAINDVSIPYGGDTPQHSGHETGLSCDLLLPIHPDRDVKKLEYGTVWDQANYDRNAMRAMLQALHQQPLLKFILFNDPQLIAEGLCSQWPSHDNHVHFELKVPPLRP